MSWYLGGLGTGQEQMIKNNDRRLLAQLEAIITDDGYLDLEVRNQLVALIQTRIFRYTGLSDRNGAKIYEGDKIKVEYPKLPKDEQQLLDEIIPPSGIERFPEGIYQVYFSAGSFVVRAGSWVWSIGQFAEGEIEVVTREKGENEK